MADVQQNIETENKQRFRSSNLELYRIICMLMIVAHHFVVNSGLTSVDGPMVASPDSAKTLFLSVLGMWGKIGINCFLMITGYFMCKSQITIKKFLKLILWIYFYKIIIFAIFLGTGYYKTNCKIDYAYLGISSEFYQLLHCFLVEYSILEYIGSKYDQTSASNSYCSTFRHLFYFRQHTWI